MAIAEKVSKAILSASNGFGLNGQIVNPLALAIGNSVAAWLSGSVTVRCVTAGTAGVGVITGVLTVPPLPGAATLFASQGMAGPQSPALASAITTGIMVGVSGAVFTGESKGVGSGTALAKVTSANLAALVSLLMQNLPAAMESQAQTQTQMQLATAVGTIISAQLLLAFGAGAIVGTVSPATAAGTATCTIVTA